MTVVGWVLKCYGFFFYSEDTGKLCRDCCTPCFFYIFISKFFFFFYFINKTENTFISTYNAEVSKGVLILKKWSHNHLFPESEKAMFP